MTRDARLHFLGNIVLIAIGGGGIAIAPRIALMHHDAFRGVFDACIGLGLILLGAGNLRQRGDHG